MNDDPYIATVRARAHGLPLTFFIRADEPEMESPVSMLPFSGQLVYWDSWAFGLNVLLTTAVAGLLHIPLRWVNQQRRRAACSMRGLFLVVFIIACACALLGNGMRQFRSARQICNDINASEKTHAELTVLAPTWAIDISDEIAAAICGYSLEVTADDPTVDNEDIIVLKALSSLPQVDALTIRSEIVDDAGLEHLSELRGVRCLTINCPRVTDKCLPLVASIPQLQYLDLSDTKITGTTLRALCRATPPFGLILRRVPITTETLDNLLTCTALTHLDLSNSHISDNESALFGALPHLQVLLLNDTKVGDNTMRSLAAAQLVVLSLAYTRVTDAGIAAAGCPDLQYLDVSGCKCTEDICAVIWRQESLETALLTKCRITEDGISRLDGHPSLRSLSLRDNPVSDRGANLLLNLPRLENVDLRWTPVSDGAVGDMMASRPSINVQFESKAPVYSLLQSQLKVARGVERSENAEAHVGFPRFDGKKIGDDDVRVISGCHEVTSLDLSDTNVTDIGLDYLTQMPNLRVISLRRTPITDQGLQRLSAIKSLEVLDVSGTSVGVVALNALASLPRLTVLRLAASSIDDASLLPLASSASLREIDLRGTVVTPAMVNELRNSREMTIYYDDEGPDDHSIRE
jgi:Leucine-rich repeat (LRR) protein